MLALVFSNKSDHILGLVEFSRKIADEIIGIIASPNFEEQISFYSHAGVKKVYKLQGEINIDNIVDLITHVANELKPGIIVFSNTKINKIIAPRVAQRINSCYLNDVSDVKFSDNKLLYQVQTLGSMAIKVIEPLTTTVIVTFSPPVIKSVQGVGAKVEVIEIQSNVHGVKIIDRIKKIAESVNIEDADIIISVGRGLKSKDDLNIIYELAKILNAEVGCSRPLATDLKWMDESRWIGLSGKKVKPRLYIAIGISGQPQHIAGINKSKIIVSINKDENAPINKNADYVVVADLYQVVPELINILRKS
ncbi:MAG: electron transfer flavoprotein subunit alpha/FixB family protein [Thermoprotei archaeon]|jgi:electron transfer flavoprotein alpha subunit